MEYRLAQQDEMIQRLLKEPSSTQMETARAELTKRIYQSREETKQEVAPK